MDILHMEPIIGSGYVRVFEKCLVLVPFDLCKQVQLFMHQT